MNASLPLEMTGWDWAAVGLYFGLWGVFNLVQDRLLRGHGIINQKLFYLRRHWMACMLARDNRMMDAVLIGHTMHSCTFFASTTILIVAGLVGAFGAIDRAHELLMSLTFTAKSSRQFFEMKMLLLAAVFIFGFFKFTWALRQFNYCLALIGSAPSAPLTPGEIRLMSANIADTMSMAVRAFNGGMRSYYFALAALGWFIDPRLFIAASLGVVIVLTTRQSTSRAAGHIEAQRALLAARADAGPPPENANGVV